MYMYILYKYTPKSLILTGLEKKQMGTSIFKILQKCENEEDLLSPVKLPLFQHLHPTEKNRNGLERLDFADAAGDANLTNPALLC